jgi:membrane-associated phospholipid phosphatase
MRSRSHDLDIADGIVGMRWKVGLAAVVLAMNVAAYAVGNRYPRIPPRLLELSAIDLATPLLPWTIWIYLLAYPLPLVAFLANQRTRDVTRLFRAYLFLLVAASLIHWLLPTVFPRELYPVPPGVGVLTVLAFELLRSIDAPASCLPSLHVATAVLCAALAYERQAPSRLLFALLAVVISVSTLTTKQHYAVDVAAGALLSLVVLGLFRAPSGRGAFTASHAVSP